MKSGTPSRWTAMQTLFAGLQRGEMRRPFHVVAVHLHGHAVAVGGNAQNQQGDQRSDEILDIAHLLGQQDLFAEGCSPHFSRLLPQAVHYLDHVRICPVHAGHATGGPGEVGLLEMLQQFSRLIAHFRAQLFDRVYLGRPVFGVGRHREITVPVPHFRYFLLQRRHGRVQPQDFRPRVEGREQVVARRGGI
jgi:hypothetical protein